MSYSPTRSRPTSQPPTPDLHPTVRRRLGAHSRILLQDILNPTTPQDSGQSASSHGRSPRTQWPNLKVMRIQNLLNHQPRRTHHIARGLPRYTLEPEPFETGSSHLYLPTLPISSFVPDPSSTRHVERHLPHIGYGYSRLDTRYPISNERENSPLLDPRFCFNSRGSSPALGQHAERTVYDPYERGYMVEANSPISDYSGYQTSVTLDRNEDNWIYPSVQPEQPRRQGTQEAPIVVSDNESEHAHNDGYTYRQQLCHADDDIPTDIAPDNPIRQERGDDGYKLEEVEMHRKDDDETEDEKEIRIHQAAPRGMELLLSTYHPSP
ncbi:hypothetical protein M426DRAFT_264846 [Hypoxylon sp. CI-4A]|nr:hypothetical protein M426DRAFT_264846 [Hypoxylon sp. CI-4A]